MPKRVAYTKITPLAANVPRQLALDMLHSHGEIIDLNPLVTGHKPIAPPRDAARDEYFAQWYEIEEIITWGFGMKKKISFKGCFHDLPTGLQTHIYAPMGVDLRNKYQIAGNQPGEPREVRELGSEAPVEGLYLREDVEITCNIALAGFVKKETKQTLETMIERMTRKAELLDDGVLMAMFENGKLKTINPNQIHNQEILRPSSFTDRTPSIGSSPSSPDPTQTEFAPSQTYKRYSQLPGRIPSKRDDQQVNELDGASNYSAAGHPQFFSDPVEMEGSTVPYSTTGPPPKSVEMPDTSSLLVPRRLSNVSYSSSNRSEGALAADSNARLTSASAGPPRVYSQSSNEQMARQYQQQRVSKYTVTNPSPTSPTFPRYSNGPNQHAGLTAQVEALNITKTSPAPAAKMSRCPMEKCEFQGTAEAISQHVNRHHYV